MEEMQYYVTTSIPTSHIPQYLYGNPPDLENDDGSLHDIGTVILSEEEHKQLQDLLAKIRKDRKDKKNKRSV